MLDALFEFGLPFMITAALAMMLTVEVFYHLKVKKPFRFHAKRFGMNALLLCALASSLLTVAVSVNEALSPYVGEKRSLLIALVSWSMLVAAITLKFQRTIRKYWKDP
jgi:multisubunit Na+/H+ antiporter MnhB subunit